MNEKATRGGVGGGVDGGGAVRVREREERKNEGRLIRFLLRTGNTKKDLPYMKRRRRPHASPSSLLACKPSTESKLPFTHPALFSTRAMRNPNNPFPPALCRT